MQSGRDVYCEKPLTLTIEEGKQICQVVRSTNRVFQVGTQQRSDADRFLKAVALVRAGRIGEVNRAWVAIDGGVVGGPFKKLMCPAELNYEMWLGQAPLSDYIPERVYYTFRWWYDYSGGKLTDWGAHHVDIAQWVTGNDDTSPVTVEPLLVEHPVPFTKEGFPTVDHSFNTAVRFRLKCQFANGFELRLQDSVNEPGLADFNNGVLFEGTKGRFFVNRGKIVGKPVEDLADNPLPEGAIEEIYGGKVSANHTANFIEGMQSRQQPISDVWTHNRMLEICHLSNIALRLGRELKWDPEKREIIGDEQANTFLARESRKGFEINR
jgi:predicted dehydrogenase